MKMSTPHLNDTEVSTTTGNSNFTRANDEPTFLLDYKSAWSHPIVGSGFEHVEIPQLASYDPWQSGFASSNDFQSLDSSLLGVASANAGFGHHTNIPSVGGTSTVQSNIDTTWSYGPTDRHFEDSAYLQLPYQALPPVWSSGPFTLPLNALDTHQRPYQNSTATSPFDSVNLPSNDPVIFRQPYQQALVPLPPSPEVPQHSAPAAILLPRQHPASLTARKTTKTVDKNQFQCSYCRKTFARAGDCRRHEAGHGPPKYRCIVIDCDMTFHRRDKLSDHVKVHKLKVDFKVRQSELE